VLSRATGSAVIEIHRRTGYLLIATLLAQVILISAQVRTASGSRVLQAVTFGVFSQVQLGTAWVFSGIRSVWDGYVGLRGAHQENQQLRDTVSQMQVRLLEQQALAMRASQLEQILDLRQRTPLRTVAASVIAGDFTRMFRTLTIDKGSSSGLRKDMAVIAPAGIVGRIVEPPPLYAAKVQLLIDREAGAGAIIARSGVGGVVVGHDRDGEPQLELDFVSNLSDAKVGDRLVTSGLDGIFPRGLTIGYLATVEKGSGLYKKILVTPAVDFEAIGSVLVVLDPPQAVGPSPAGGVGTSAAAATPARPAAARPEPPRPGTAPATAAAAAPAQATPAQPARTTPPAPRTPPQTPPRQNPPVPPRQNPAAPPPTDTAPAPADPAPAPEPTSPPPGGRASRP
jgi:rod shape-determining protein MreC